MNINSIIESIDLTFDNEILNQEKITIKPNINFKFGLLKIKICKTQITKKKQHFIFTIDCSGSMNDMCSDKKSKIQHIKKTLENMFYFFINNINDTDIYISIYGFDDKIYKIIQNEKISLYNIELLIEKLNKLKPLGSTDIELAINNTSKVINFYYTNNDDKEITNIFMTDGEATSGNTCHKDLKKLLNPYVSNIFIGFGINHNYFLLNSLSSDINNHYYFIDKIENNGMIYGEIIHNVLYKCLTNINITVNNGLIYDYKNNIWLNNIKISDFVSDTEKFFHVVSYNTNNTDNIELNIVGIINNTGEIININKVYNVFENKTLDEIYIDKYKYRQRILQLLYEVNSFNNNYCDEYFYSESNLQELLKDYTENKCKLKNKMNNLFKEIKMFMKNNSLNSDTFMNNLCDDIYISYKTFGTKYSSMYTCSRQISQGNQRSYTVSEISDIKDFEYTNFEDDIFELTPSPIDKKGFVLKKIKTPLKQEHDLNSSYNIIKSEEKEEVDVNIDDYKLSDTNNMTSYATESVIGVIYDITNRQNNRINRFSVNYISSDEESSDENEKLFVKLKHF
jgi:hypothetical protein